MFECGIKCLNRIDMNVNFCKTILKIVRIVFNLYQCLIRIKNQFENQDGTYDFNV